MLPFDKQLLSKIKKACLRGHTARTNDLIIRDYVKNVLTYEFITQRRLSLNAIDTFLMRNKTTAEFFKLPVAPVLTLLLKDAYTRIHKIVDGNNIIYNINAFSCSGGA